MADWLSEKEKKMNAMNRSLISTCFSPSYATQPSLLTVESVLTLYKRDALFRVMISGVIISSAILHIKLAFSH